MPSRECLAIRIRTILTTYCVMQNGDHQNRCCDCQHREKPVCDIMEEKKRPQCDDCSFPSVNL